MFPILHVFSCFDIFSIYPLKTVCVWTYTLRSIGNSTMICPWRQEVSTSNTRFQETFEGSEAALNLLKLAGFERQGALEKISPKGTTFLWPKWCFIEHVGTWKCRLYRHIGFFWWTYAKFIIQDVPIEQLQLRSTFWETNSWSHFDIYLNQPSPKNWTTYVPESLPELSQQEKDRKRSSSNIGKFLSIFQGANWWNFARVAFITWPCRPRRVLQVEWAIHDGGRAHPRFLAGGRELCAVDGRKDV